MSHPVLFVGHGNPMNAISDNRWSRSFAELGKAVPRPRAILAVSAHWQTHGSQVTTQERPRTIHDFSGFPPELSEVDYPAPGAPALAAEVARLLPAPVVTTTEWGLDHGTWSVLRHMFPEADVPTVQMSIAADATSAKQMEIGAALASLREEGVLIVGSGNLVHNLPSAFRKWRAGQTETETWATSFDSDAARALDSGDTGWLATALEDEQGRHAHPTPEHFQPLLYAVGAAGPSEVTFPITGFDMGDISMRAVRFD